MRYEATITSKGQLTLPARLRDFLNVKAGDKIVFVAKTNGDVVLEARHRTFDDLRGIVKLEGAYAHLDAWIEAARAAMAEGDRE